MSDSDSNDTVIPDEVLSLPSFARNLSRTLSAEVDEDMAILRKLMRDDKQTTTSVRTPATTLSMGIMKIKICTTSVEMVQMMVPLISKKFTMTVEVITELLVQLSVYFSHMGIHNKEFLTFMTNYVD